MHFGQHLRAILKQKSCTQQRAGELLEMSQQAFAYYLTKAKPPRPHILAHMSARLEISMDELTGKPAGAVVRETAAVYGDPLAPVWARLKRRWQSGKDRATLEVDLRRVFTTDAEKILAWLNEK